MKKIKRIKTNVFRMLAILAVTSLSACNGHDMPEQEAGVSGGVPLRIGGASTSTITATSALSRAADRIRELNDATDAIGIFLAAGNGYEAINNNKYSYWTPYWVTDGEYLILGQKSGSLVAYYPYDEWQLTPVATLQTRVYSPKNELYYQTFNASYMTPAVWLSLKRAYALIRFSFIRGEADVPVAGDGAYQGDGSITAFSFTANLARSGKLDLFTDVLTGATPEAMTLTSAAPDVPFSIGSNETPASKDFLTVPISSYNGDLTFTATVDGKTMGGKVTAKELCGTLTTMKAGFMYEIKVTVRPTALTVTGISQEIWDEQDMPGELEATR